MKANEFVKTHGIKAAQDIVKHYGNHTHITDDARMFITEEFYKRTSADYVDDLNSMVRMVDLKRLVESHNVVSQYQSLDAAKERLQYFINWLAEHWTHAEFAPEIAKFKQAILDVESCL